MSNAYNLYEATYMQDANFTLPLEERTDDLVNDKWPSFAIDPRNLRPSLADDEFNPFGNLSATYSCWPELVLRHNLDVMHLEKNVRESILGILLDINGKTKDEIKALKDLQDMGIRQELHPHDRESRTYLSPAPNTLSKVKSERFQAILRKNYKSLAKDDPSVSKTNLKEDTFLKVLGFENYGRIGELGRGVTFSQLSILSQRDNTLA
ncbi:hypothetical protein Ddye_001612 [Dipteronia dyeriana]|uniref:Uncharacterized protein n=1 Tax=Dipteronia dyeriana TaxID=168575 RepID=A0AAD9XQ73_9ROSI|nr:hypothetical protein Ddye_001612 [Dipteronia dyeriana]